MSNATQEDPAILITFELDQWVGVIRLAACWACFLFLCGDAVVMKEVWSFLPLAAVELLLHTEIFQTSNCRLLSLNAPNNPFLKTCRFLLGFFLFFFFFLTPLFDFSTDFRWRREVIWFSGHVKQIIYLLPQSHRWWCSSLFTCAAAVPCSVIFSIWRRGENQRMMIELAVNIKISGLVEPWVGKSFSCLV